MIANYDSQGLDFQGELEYFGLNNFHFFKYYFNYFLVFVINDRVVFLYHTVTRDHDFRF